MEGTTHYYVAVCIGGHSGYCVVLWFIGCIKHSPQ